MIPDFFLNALFGGISALLNLGPTISFDGDAAATTTFDVTALIVDVIPLFQLIYAILFCAAIKLALMGWDFIVWAYHQFWGSG